MTNPFILQQNFKVPETGEMNRDENEKNYSGTVSNIYIEPSRVNAQGVIITTAPDHYIILKIETITGHVITWPLPYARFQEFFYWAGIPFVEIKPHVGDMVGSTGYIMDAITAANRKVERPIIKTEYRGYVDFKISLPQAHPFTFTVVGYKTDRENDELIAVDLDNIVRKDPSGRVYGGKNQIKIQIVLRFGVHPDTGKPDHLTGYERMLNIPIWLYHIDPTTMKASFNYNKKEGDGTLTFNASSHWGAVTFISKLMESVNFQIPSTMDELSDFRVIQMQNGMHPQETLATALIWTDLLEAVIQSTKPVVFAGSFVNMTTSKNAYIPTDQISVWDGVKELRNRSAETPQSDVQADVDNDDDDEVAFPVVAPTVAEQAEVPQAEAPSHAWGNLSNLLSEEAVPEQDDSSVVLFGRALSILMGKGDVECLDEKGKPIEGSHITSQFENLRVGVANGVYNVDSFADLSSNQLYQSINSLTEAINATVPADDQAAFASIMEKLNASS